MTKLDNNTEPFSFSTTGKSKRVKLPRKMKKRFKKSFVDGWYKFTFKN